jgi:cobalamin biosynthesis Mg chelatase CobN
MKKLLFLAIMAIALMACKTTKTASSYEQNSTATAVTESKEVAKKEAATETATKVTDRSTIDSNEVGETTTVYFSAPDSTGKQSVTAITTTTYQKGSQIKNDISAENDNKTTLNQTITKTDNSTTKTANEVNATEKTKTESNTPTWVIVIVVICLLGLLLWLVHLAFVVCRRFRLGK